MGMTGDATGIHLHYEVTIDGLKVDPLNYGAGQVTQVNQSHNSPIDVSPQPRPAAPVEISHKPDAGAPDASVIETPNPSVSSPSPSSPPAAALPAPPQPPASEPLQVSPDGDGWTPGKSR